MSLNIAGNNNVINVTSPSTSSSQTLNRLEQDLGQIANLFAQRLGDGMDSLRPQLANLQPASAQQPADPYQAAYTSMDPTKAAKTLLANFSAVEGVGMNEKGEGAGDSNIGRRELERVADPNSGFPPDVRAAAKWMLDHPTSTRSIDQGASKADGDANEFHLSPQDLQAFVANSPAQSEGSGKASGIDPSELFQLASALLDGSADPMGGMRGSESRQAVPSFGAPSAGGPSALPSAGPATGGKIDNVFDAAKQVQNYFQFIEGVGMNESGAGAGDGNIGMSELKRVADPNSGAPEKVRQAAQFLIDHPTGLTALDQAAGADGQKGEVHIGKADVDAFLANNGPKQAAPESTTAAFLQRSFIAC